jgi:superfamily II DNA or RNA helicase
MSKDREIVRAEALDAVRSLHRASIAGSMGIGKTLIGLTHMNERYTDYVLYLIVAPKISVFQTWKDEAEKHGLLHLIPHMKFTTYLSMWKHDLNKYDGVYLDEFHSIKESHEESLEAYTGPILGLSGTPPKGTYGEKAKMMAKYCPIAYEYTVDEAVEDNILNDYEIVIHHLKLSEQKNIQVKGKTWFTSEKSIYDYWCTRIDNARTAKELQITRIMRMKAMMDFPTKTAYAKRLVQEIGNKVLLFANTTAQADSFKIPSYHSGNLQSEQNLINFKDGIITKLACVLQLSEGVNIPGLKELIVIHSYSNNRKLAQRLGRGLRLGVDEKAIIHVLCFDNTVDVQWIKTSLEDFDQNKMRDVYQ